VVAVLVLLGLVLGRAPVAHADPPSVAACAAQQAQLDGMEAKRLAHNAQPHLFLLPQQQAQYDAYNAQRDRLIAEFSAKQAELERCLNALRQLYDESRSTYRPDPTEKAAANIIARLRQLPPVPSSYTPPPAPAANQRALVPTTSPIRPFYDLLRKGNPSRNLDATFQGKPKPAVGDADPAYPGRTIRSVNGRPDVSADHIVPLSDLVNLPGFARLSPENMWLLSRSPVNFQWMSRTANESKNSGLAGRITGADPGWMAQQDALQMQTRQKLIDLIKQLNGEG
jgi:hypothetical protein